ncbi:hypothetical protein [Rufibacter sp. XAAS-G3-1]|uniref:hypothetical protein n=1 Tax=Rufibacter sp. XAAS-G3-1 TaxID=2729134 RepID=UPI0015E78890|nr:hypothetical protein [Rufibacter sp. XAAS-G3-1]
MDTVKETIDRIKNEKHFYDEREITIKKYILDSSLKLTESGDIHERYNSSQFFIYTFYYFCKTHVTMGGNVYLKPNFELLVHDFNNEEAFLEYNGWRVIDLQTFGTCDYNYPQKQMIRYRLQDYSGNNSDLLIVPNMLGGYEEIFKSKIEIVLKSLMEASSHENLKELSTK